MEELGSRYRGYIRYIIRIIDSLDNSTQVLKCYFSVKNPYFISSHFLKRQLLLGGWRRVEMTDQFFVLKRMML